MTSDLQFEDAFKSLGKLASNASPWAPPQRCLFTRVGIGARGLHVPSRCEMDWIAGTL